MSISQERKTKKMTIDEPVHPRHAELALEEELRGLGFAVTSEVPDDELGTIVLTARHTDSGTDVTAQGDTRYNALLAVLTAARSKGL